MIDYSRTGANQDKITEVLQKFLNAIPLYPACSDWVEGGIVKASDMVTVLLNMPQYGHGTFDVTTTAFVGHVNVTGVPLDGTITVNDIGMFFSATDPQGQRLKPLGGKFYRGGTLRAQLAILIHEVGHLAKYPGFLPDGGKPQNGKINDDNVDKFCRQLIEGVQ